MKPAGRTWIASAPMRDRSTRLRTLALSGAVLAAAALAGAQASTVAQERVHVAREGALQASSLWRSERGLDRSARQLLEVIAAVDGAGAPRASDLVGEGEPPLEVLLAESPAKLARRAGRKGERLQFLSELEGTGLPCVALAPHLNDRVLFGTGLPPRTRRLAALAAAGLLRREAGRAEPAWRAAGADQLRAQRGLEAMGHARSMAMEPWISDGLLGLQRALAPVAEEERARALLDLATAEVAGREVFDPGGGFQQVPAEAARMLLALEAKGESPGEPSGESEQGGAGAEAPLELARRAAERLRSVRPRWRMEGGAVASHPVGWMATATQVEDALVLEADPFEGGAFELEASVVIFANSPKFAGQADIVLGDREGDRLLLAVNTREGVYLFRRPARNADYVPLAELHTLEIPPFTEIPIRVVHDGEVVKVEVGGVALPPVRLGDRDLDGAMGFGCHAGSTVFFKRFERRQG